MESSMRKIQYVALDSPGGFLSLLSLDELGQHVVKNSFDQAAKLENLKKIRADNEKNINALCSDVTLSRMQLEELDKIYHVESPSLNNILKSSVVEAHQIYGEIIQEQDSYKVEVQKAETLLGQLRSDMWKVKTADEALWVEIKGAEEGAKTIIADMDSLKDDNDNFREIRKLVTSVHNEKTRLLESLSSSIQEIETLEKDGGDEEKINEDLEQALHLKQLSLHQGKENETLYAEVRQRIQDLMHTIKKRDSQLNHLKEKLTGDTIKLQEVEEKIMKTNYYCKEIEGSIVKVEQALQEMKSGHEVELNVLKESVEEKEGRLKEVLLLNDEMNNHYKKLKNEIHNNMEQYKKLIEKLIQMKMELKELSEREVKILIPECENVSGRRQRLLTQIETARAAISLTSQKLEKREQEEKEMTKKFNELSEALEEITKKAENLAVEKKRVITDIEDATADNQRLWIQHKKVKRDISQLEISEPGLLQLQDPVEGKILLKKLRESMEDLGRVMEANVTDLLETTIGKEATLTKELQRVEEDIQSVSKKITVDEELLLDKKATLAKLCLEVERGSKEKNRLRAFLKETQEKVIQAKQKAMELNFVLQTERCLDKPRTQGPIEAMVFHKSDSEDENLSFSAYCNKRKLSSTMLKGSQKSQIMSSEENVAIPPFTEPKKRLKPNAGKAKYLMPSVSSTVHFDSDEELF